MQLRPLWQPITCQYPLSSKRWKFSYLFIIAFSQTCCESHFPEVKNASVLCASFRFPTQMHHRRWFIQYFSNSQITTVFFNRFPKRLLNPNCCWLLSSLKMHRVAMFATKTRAAKHKLLYLKENKTKKPRIVLSKISLAVYMNRKCLYTTCVWWVNAYTTLRAK